MGPYGILWDPMGPYSTEPSHWALLVRDNGAMEVRPYSTLEHPMGPYGTLLDPMGPYGIL